MALTHPDLPVAFKSLDGAASFDPERIVLKGFRAQDGHSDLKVDGHITGYREWGSAEKRTSFNVTAEGWIGRATLLPFIKGSALEDALFKGRILFKGRVHGRPDSVLAEGGLDLTDTDLEYKRLIKKALGYPMTLEGIAGLNRKELIINRMKLGFGESAVGLEGRVFTDRPVYSLSVSSDRLNLSDLDDVSPYLAAGSNSGGFVSFGFNTGRTEQALRPIYEGDIRITDGRFSTPFLARPVEKINAEASIRKNEAHIVIENMSAGKTEVTGRVDIPDIAGRAVNFEFNSPRFFVEDIFKRRPAQGGSAEEKAGIIGLFIKEAGEKDASPDAPPITGAGVIKIKEGGAFGHSIDGLTLEVRLDRDRVYLNPEPFFWNKGLTTGRLVVYREPSSELLFESELGFTDMDLGRLISGLGAKDKLLTGAVNGRVELIGKRAVPTASGINGTASLESENGRLWKFLVMSKIFSIVNIISIDELFTDGLPYKKASGDFYVKDGVISANNLLLDSASLRMSA
ncbi:MAG: hypothetical protein HZB83_07085, partial [Deltaproteobacteria bacterium]|nr:hypothetical protein [Deltaproteobacteria bacterium]